MAYGRITEKQQEILDYIKNEILNRGFPPAVREICEAVNLKSTSSVHSHLEALEKNGYIRNFQKNNNIIQIFSAIITGVISYLGIRIKNLYQEYIQDKLKKEIVDKTVKYVEQTCKDVTCEEKKRKALEKSLEWMKEKKLNVSDTELEILIESAVNCL